MVNPTKADQNRLERLLRDFKMAESRISYEFGNDLSGYNVNSLRVQRIKDIAAIESIIEYLNKLRLVNMKPIKNIQGNHLC